MGLNKLTDEEAIAFVELLAAMSPRELLDVYGNQILRQVYIAGQIELSRPILSPEGEVIKAEDDFVELEAEHWQLKDEIYLTRTYLLMSMKKR